MKKRAPQILIPHFRGLSDLRGRMRDRGYSPHLEGVIDRRGGNLNRLGGSISATSGPHSTIWAINQLQFQTGWNFAVNDGEHRRIYEQGLPWEGLHLDNHPDWYDVPGIADIAIQHPGPNFGHREDGMNHDPRRHPSVCHSWWDWRYGEWRLPVTDFKVCQRRRLGNYAVSGAYITVSAALDKLWEDNPIGETGAWLPWNTGTAPLNSPADPDDAYFVGSLCAVQGNWHPASNKYGARFGLRIMQNKVCSNTLGDPPTPPTGGEYEKAYYLSGTGIGGLQAFANLGMNCIRCIYPPPTIQVCADLCTTAFEELIRIPSRAEIPDDDALVPHDGAYHDLYREEFPYHGDQSQVWLVAKGGVIDKHDEFCFGEK